MPCGMQTYMFIMSFAVDQYKDWKYSSECLAKSILQHCYFDSNSVLFIYYWTVIFPINAERFKYENLKSKCNSYSSATLHFIMFFVTSSSESLTRCVLLTFTFRNNIFMSGFCLRETLSTRLCYLNGKKKSYMQYLHLKNTVPYFLNITSP